MVGVLRIPLAEVLYGEGPAVGLHSTASRLLRERMAVKFAVVLLVVRGQQDSGFLDGQSRHTPARPSSCM